MKNIAVIFAGGSGKRMNTVSRPKQFLELNGKPVIIYTLELFDNHPQIDGVVVVCIEDWLPFLEKQLLPCLAFRSSDGICILRDYFSLFFCEFLFNQTH